MLTKEKHYFRVKYQKLKTEIKLSNGLRCDFKFAADNDNNLVFFLYPEFECLSDESIVGEEWEALDEGTALIHRPIFQEQDHAYHTLLKQRVCIGAKGYFVAGSERIAQVEIIELLNEPWP